MPRFRQQLGPFLPSGNRYAATTNGGVAAALSDPFLSAQLLATTPEGVNQIRQGITYANVVGGDLGLERHLLNEGTDGATRTSSRRKTISQNQYADYLRHLASQSTPEVSPQIVANPHVESQPKDYTDLALDFARSAENASPEDQERLGRGLFALGQIAEPDRITRDPGYKESRRRAAAEYVSAVDNAEVQKELQKQLLQTAGTFVRGQIANTPRSWAAANPDAVNRFNTQILGPAPSEQDYAVYKQRADAEAAQRANLMKWASGPSVTDAQKVEALMQHEQQYGDIINNPPPPTREELLLQAQAAELSQYQSMLPNVPLLRDEKGKIVVLPGFSEVRMADAQQFRAETEAARTQQKEIERQYNFENEQLKASAPAKPDVTSPTYANDLRAYQQYQQSLAGKQRAIYERYYGKAPGDAAAQPPASPAAAPPALAVPLNFEDGGRAEAAFKAGRIKPGQPVTVNGVAVVFDSEGNATRVN